MALPLQPRLGTMTAMVSHRMTDAPVPLEEHVPTADQFVLMRGDWETYEALLNARGERPRPLIAFLDDVVELMTTSMDHERIKSVLGCLLEAYCLEKGFDFSVYGHTTHKKKSVKAGAEPDECYVFGRSKRDPRTFRADLAIEVVWTSGGIDKLEIYRRLQIPEVWFWEKDIISIHVLGQQGYVQAERSQFVPDIDLDLICRLVPVEPHSDAIRQLLATLRRQGE